MASQKGTARAMPMFLLRLAYQHADEAHQHHGPARRRHVGVRRHGGGSGSPSTSLNRYAIFLT